MNIFEALWANRPLVCAASAWLLAQVIKFVLYSFIEKTISWRRLWGSGGMPSSHTAFTLALALSDGGLQHHGLRHRLCPDGRRRIRRDGRPL